MFGKKNNLSLIAVCCELREGLRDNYILNKSLKIGEFLSLPDFCLIKNNNENLKLTKGNNSVIFEIYEITESTLEKINRIKKFISVESFTNNNYQQIINTPYGKAITYFTEDVILEDDKIIFEYDYTDYCSYQN